MDTVLEATDLTKHYEDFRLRGVSLAVRHGSIAGVFGPNAAGKSTLLRMLAGQTPVPAGTLRVLDQSFAAAERDLKNRIGYVPQEPVFFENRTAEWLGGAPWISSAALAALTLLAYRALRHIGVRVKAESEAHL